MMTGSDGPHSPPLRPLPSLFLSLRSSGSSEPCYLSQKCRKYPALKDWFEENYCTKIQYFPGMG